MKQENFFFPMMLGLLKSNHIRITRGVVVIKFSLHAKINSKLLTYDRKYAIICIREGDYMERTYGIMIKQIHDYMEKNANNNLRSQGLTMAQVGALMELHSTEERQMSLKELERRLHIAQSTAAGIVVRLEQKGFLESFGDATDRRVKMVRMTPKGEKCFQSAEENMKCADEKLLGSLTMEERMTLLHLLKKVCDGIQ